MAPASSLATAGIEVEGRDVYELANDEVVEYPFGFARVSCMGSETVAQTIFGPEGCEPILGTVAFGEYRPRNGSGIAQPQTNGGQALEVKMVWTIRSPSPHSTIFPTAGCMACGAFFNGLFLRGGLEDLKATLLVESPIAFRRCMLFVGRDVLDRPRRFSAAGRQ